MDGRDHAKRKLSRDARERGGAFSACLSLFFSLSRFFLSPRLIRRRKPGEREREREREKEKGRVRSLISVVVVEARCD